MGLRLSGTDGSQELLIDVQYDHIFSFAFFHGTC